VPTIAIVDGVKIQRFMAIICHRTFTPSSAEKKSSSPSQGLT